MRYTIKHLTPNGQFGCPPDNTSEHIAEAVRQWRGASVRDRRVVHVQVAMEIASWWQCPSGYGMDFAAFQSTGTITGDLRAAIDSEILQFVAHIQEAYPVAVDGEYAAHAADMLNALCALDAYIVAATR
jgi:hypothetical protein